MVISIENVFPNLVLFHIFALKGHQFFLPKSDSEFFGIFEDFDDHVVLLLWFSVCDSPVNDGREDVERRIQ